MKVKKQCSATGCDAVSRSKGMCSKHYAKKHLDPAKARAYSLANPYSILKRTANQRKIPVSISKDEYLELRARLCYYCGGPLPILGVGLDREDRTKGYHLDNVVPSCAVCNSFRGHKEGDRFTVDEMKFLMTQLKIYRAIKK